MIHGLSLEYSQPKAIFYIAEGLVLHYPLMIAQWINLEDFFLGS